MGFYEKEWAVVNTSRLQRSRQGEWFPNFFPGKSRCSYKSVKRDPSNRLRLWKRETARLWPSSEETNTSTSLFCRLHTNWNLKDKEAHRSVHKVPLSRQSRMMGRGLSGNLNSRVNPPLSAKIGKQTGLHSIQPLYCNLCNITLSILIIPKKHHYFLF